MQRALSAVSRRAVPSLARVRTLAGFPGGFPPPRLFDYETVTKNLTVNDAIESIEKAFGALANDKVDVPLPMHIGPLAGEPGDCHIKGGYILGTKTFTVKLACVSFYKNAKLSPPLPPGSGIFVVVDAETGAPLGIFQENRFMTDLRTGAAGGISFKYLSAPTDDRVGFIGCGAIARVMARAAAAIRPYKGFAYAQAGAAEFCADMQAELDMPFTVIDSARELCGAAQVPYTQITPGSETVRDRAPVSPHIRPRCPLPISRCPGAVHPDAWLRDRAPKGVAPAGHHYHRLGLRPAHEAGDPHRRARLLQVCLRPRQASLPRRRAPLRATGRLYERGLSAPIT